MSFLVERKNGYSTERPSHIDESEKTKRKRSEESDEDDNVKILKRGDSVEELEQS